MAATPPTTPPMIAASPTPLILVWLLSLPAPAPELSEVPVRKVEVLSEVPVPKVEVLSEVSVPKVEVLSEVPVPKSGLEDESLSVGGSDARVWVVADCVDSSVAG